MTIIDVFGCGALFPNLFFGIFSAWHNTNTIHSAQEMSIGLENELKL